MRSFRTLATYGFLGVMAFVSVFPFAWMIIGATNTSADIIKGRSWPGSALAENLSTLVTTNNVPEILYNSFKVAIIGTALTLLVASMAGYGFEVFKSRFKDRVFGGLLLLMSIPFAALMVPLFVLTGKIGLINTHIGVILPSVAALSLLFIMFYFRQATIAFPSELRDAARVDGLKEWQIFAFICMPVMKSTYAAATIIVFMAQWNSYLWPLIVLQTNDKKTITLAISSLGTQQLPDYGALMVATILATLPTLLIFFVLQRQFVQGMLGAVK